MRVEKRVRALETRYVREPVILTFPDGTTAELRGHGDFLLRLLADFCAGAELRPEQVAQLDLIRRSSGAREPGGARMTEVLRCVLDGPVETKDTALVDASGSQSE